MGPSRGNRRRGNNMGYHHYWDHDSQNTHEQGHRDERMGRPNYDYDRHSDQERDRAYFEGRVDERRVADDRRQEERAEEEAAERRRHHSIAHQHEEEIY